MSAPTHYTSQYNRVSQVIHWVSALLILGMFPLGLIMHELPDGTQKQIMYNIHVTVGLMVIVVTVFRLVWLARRRWPEPLPELSPLRLKLFTATHVFLYIALVVALLSGIAMVISSGLLPMPGTIDPERIRDLPPRMIHDIFSKLLFVALIIHVVGVIDYQVRKGDTLFRMGITVFRKNS